MIPPAHPGAAPPGPTDAPAWTTARPTLAVIGVALAASLLAGWAGAGRGGTLSLVSTLHLLLTSAWPGAMAVAASIGLGRAFTPLLRGSRDPLLVQATLGLGLYLTFTHALGALGLVEGPLARAIAIGVPLGGLALAGEQAWRARHALSRAFPPTVVLPWILAAPAVGVMFAAACVPPGWLWLSEGNGYDVVSYHLQLPQEWYLAGRLRPFDHNVYSWLPGYVEAAYLHLMVVLGLPRAGQDGLGLLSRGDAVVACQMLHAWFAMFAAWCVARAVRGVLPQADGWLTRMTPGFCGALVLATPWTVVVGSMAYNEMPMVALGAAALAAALDTGMSDRTRATVSALLVGLACGAKPTALTLLGGPVGAALALSIPPRRWLACALPAVGVGLAALAPWLARNAAWGPNPVFPFAASIFGDGHWTHEQTHRFADAHRFTGSPLDRFRAVFLPMGSTARGFFHVQWGVFWPLATAGAVVALARDRGARILAAMLGAFVVAWLLTTHVQSRFLLAGLAPAVLLLASGARTVGRWGSGIVAATTLAHAALAWTLFLSERGGRPTMLVPFGTAVFTGQGTDASIDAGSRAACNRLVGPRSRVYLLGGAPFYFTCPVEYHTTYDASPLGDAIERHPDDPHAWTRALLDLGIDHVLVDERDLVRLWLSDPSREPTGWADPRVTPERLDRWLATLPTLAAWPEAGQRLVHLRTSGASP